MEIGLDERQRRTLSPFASGTWILRVQGGRRDCGVDYDCSRRHRRCGIICTVHALHGRVTGVETGGRYHSQLPKTFRASGERSRLHAACPNDFKNGRGRNLLSQPMGNGERTWSRGATGNRSRKTVRRRLVPRTGGSSATRATYSVYTDSGGVIPAFIKNAGSQIGIRKIFAAIRKQVRDPKYSTAK